MSIFVTSRQKCLSNNSFFMSTLTTWLSFTYAFFLQNHKILVYKAISIKPSCSRIFLKLDLTALGALVLNSQKVTNAIKNNSFTTRQNSHIVKTGLWRHYFSLQHSQFFRVSYKNLSWGYFYHQTWMKLWRWTLSFFRNNTFLVV